MEQTDHKEIPLNIVMTYPVRWGTYAIFRDFIQNFYDSVSLSEWSQRFHHTYGDGKLIMWVENVTFSYEWLMHIGASTKTDDIGKQNAGYFGEGFKIASLCALRDKKWNVCMSSGDWTLDVITLKQKIDGNEVGMLGYDVRKRGFVDESRLVLANVTQEEYSIFLSSVKSFFYDDNPLLGQKIWEGRRGAVYTCNLSEYRSDYNLPYTYDYGRDGVVFCAHQLLGSNPYGLVFCLHDYKQEDRERRRLYKFEVVQAVGEICTEISPDGAAKVLEKMRRSWNTVPKNVDITSWAPVIRTLIVRIARSQDATLEFKERFPYLLYLPPIHTIQEKNRRSEAYAWLRQQVKPYLTVQVSFEILGYPSLEEECEKNGGFVLDGYPSKQENSCIEVLEEAAVSIYGDFFKIDKEHMPQRRIITNPLAVYHGMASMLAIKKPETNDRGLKLKNEITKIYLKNTVFQKDSFYDAFSTYIHELCHSFGGDSSQSFSLSLTYVIEILMKHHDEVEQYKKRWDKLFESNDLSEAEGKKANTKKKEEYLTLTQT